MIIINILNTVIFSLYDSLNVQLSKNICILDQWHNLPLATIGLPVTAKKNKLSLISRSHNHSTVKVYQPEKNALLVFGVPGDEGSHVLAMSVVIWELLQDTLRQDVALVFSVNFFAGSISNSVVYLWKKKKSFF